MICVHFLRTVHFDKYVDFDSKVYKQTLIFKDAPFNSRGGGGV